MKVKPHNTTLLQEGRDIGLFGDECCLFNETTSQDREQTLKKHIFEDCKVKLSEFQCSPKGKNQIVENAYFKEDDYYENNEDEELWTPDFILPFTIDKKESIKKLQEWFNKKWLFPHESHKIITQQLTIRGVFLPYWCYDVLNITSYYGARGFYNAHECRPFDMYTEWDTASGFVSEHFSNFTLAGSDYLTEKFKRIENWDFNNAIEFKKDMLKGYDVKHYRSDFVQSFSDAKKIMSHSVEEKIKKQIGGDIQNIMYTSSSWSNIMFCQILVPVWEINIKTNKEHLLLINGRTGQIVSSYPKNRKKNLLLSLLLLTSLGIFAIILMLLFFN